MNGQTHLTWESSSPDETEWFGEALGRLLEAGDVVALCGDLGGGKTTMTHGIARGLEVPSRFTIQSPTFSLVHEYPGRVPLIHMDLYRIEGGPEGDELGLEELLESDGAAVIEWADRLGDDLPEDALVVELIYEGECQRKISVTGRTDRALGIIRALAAELTKRNQRNGR